MQYLTEELSQSDWKKSHQSPRMFRLQFCIVYTAEELAWSPENCFWSKKLWIIHAIGLIQQFERLLLGLTVCLRSKAMLQRSIDSYFTLFGTRTVRYKDYTNRRRQSRPSSAKEATKYGDFLSYDEMYVKRLEIYSLPSIRLVTCQGFFLCVFRSTTFFMLFLAFPAYFQHAKVEFPFILHD